MKQICSSTRKTFLNYAFIAGAFTAMLAAVPAGLYAQTPTIFGTPSNFDVLNDTGQDVHGFEVELDGLQPADLGGVWSFSRYSYQILTTPAGIVIHWASPY